MKKLKSMKWIVTMSLMMFFVSCQAQGPSKNAEGKTIKNEVLDAASYKEKIKENGIQFVDVRTPGEHNAGHIDGSINIDFTSPNFKEQIAKLDKTKPVAIYCASGNRSGRASKVMLEMGFVEIYDLAGGYGRWR